MDLTERDKDMLRWINGFGFVMVYQVQEWMGNKKSVVYSRIKKLETMGAVTRSNILGNGPTVITPTKLAMGFIGDSLKPLGKVSSNGFEHDRMLVDLSFELLREYDAVKFEPERVIRRDEERNIVSDTRHCSDGYLHLQNGDKIAIELELTRKSIFRLKKIVRDHESNMRIKEVWYFCSPDLVEFLTRITSDPEFFKIIEWNGGELCQQNR